MATNPALKTWAENGWIRAHPVDKAEITRLLATAEQDLEDCRTPGLSTGWRFNIAYSAVLVIADAALASSGYRAQREAHHYWTIQSLSLTMGIESQLVDQIDSYRKKRNIATYDEIAVVSETEVREITEVARELWERLLKKLGQTR
jgi:hypothetical protein